MNEIELGVKRRCISCGTKFYDFLKSPITCPKCGAEFDPEQLLKSRKGRVASKSAVIEATKKETDEDVFQTDSLLAGAEIEADIDAVEDDGLPADEESFVAVSSNEDETTAPATFEDDEEFMDELAEDADDDDIDADEDAVPLSENEEEQGVLVDIGGQFEQDTQLLKNYSGAIAQLGERYNGIVEVVGSIPIGSTNFLKMQYHGLSHRWLYNEKMLGRLLVITL